MGQDKQARDDERWEGKRTVGFIMHKASQGDNTHTDNARKVKEQGGGRKLVQELGDIYH